MFGRPRLRDGSPCIPEGREAMHSSAGPDNVNTGSTYNLVNLEAPLKAQALGPTPISCIQGYGLTT